MRRQESQRGPRACPHIQAREEVLGRTADSWVGLTTPPQSSAELFYPEAPGRALPGPRPNIHKLNSSVWAFLKQTHLTQLRAWRVMLRAHIGRSTHFQSTELGRQSSSAHLSTRRWQTHTPHLNTHPPRHLLGNEGRSEHP